MNEMSEIEYRSVIVLSAAEVLAAATRVDASRF